MSKLKVDIAALCALEKVALVEYDEEIASSMVREIEQKRRDEEKSKRKKAKKQRRAK